MKNFSSCGYCRGEEKPCPDLCIKWRDPVIKGRVLMRVNLIVFLFFLGSVNVCASGFAQSVTLSFRDKPLIDVLNEITKQSGYELIYNSKYFGGNEKVTVTIKNQSIHKALEKCLEGQAFSFDLIDRTIVIKRKRAGVKEKIKAQRQAINIIGKVLDEKGKGMVDVTVKVKGTDIKTTTNEQGNFSINVPEIGVVLQFSFLGYQLFETTVADVSPLSIKLKQASAQLEEVGIVSTGYQSLPKERVTGSFVQIDNTLLNRKVSTNILERLDGITSGMLFNGQATKGINRYGYDARNSGINIRGQSTLQANLNPLIVVDNFPYEGEISNINPNDIENVTILKDAAAASIWGANSANGVIVITTKKGKLNQPFKAELNTSITVGNRPNLNYDNNFLNASDYIDVESHLFNIGYFDDDLNNTVAFPSISPAVELLSKLKGATTKTDSLALLSEMDGLRKNDVRDDFKKYIYQPSINQQYAFGIRGGTNNLTYAFSVGHDNNRNNLVGNSFNRKSINSQSTYNPIAKLQIVAGINYSQNKTYEGNQLEYGSSNYSMSNFKYNSLYPYARFADDSGNSLSISKDYSNDYITSTKAQGFLDWNFRPLDELKNADNVTSMSDLLMRFSANYKIIPQLSAEIQYQHERQIIDSRLYNSQETYYTRNLINKFSAYDPVARTFNYEFPLGGILNLGHYNWNAHNARAQLNYSASFGKHAINAISGAEIREKKTEGLERLSYGYDPQFGTGVSSLNYNIPYPINPSGNSFIPAPPTDSFGALYRYVSYYANASYTYNSKYSISLSGRKDGANIFGVKTNDKITPLWSTGLAWDISEEEFYRVKFLPRLKLRATYGFNGNVYQGSAYLNGFYSVNPITGAKTIVINSAPNPNLRWEKVRNINLALDFATRNNRLSGSIEFYIKNGRDLLQPTPLAGQTGFVRYLANTAKTRTSGTDITMQSRNLEGAFQWNSTLLLSTLNERLDKYDTPQTSSNMQTNGGVTGIVGKPLYGIFSYKWAGLDPETGDPQGYLNNGVSKDYTGIIKNFAPDSLVYNGSARPTVFGSLRNDFSYKGFSLSLNLVYKFGYVFRRSSVVPDYTSVLTYYANDDFRMRWREPGDESRTNVPSFTDAENSNRNTFYKYAEVLIERGDHIRLQDIRLGYDLPIKKLIKDADKTKIQIYAYASNIGIIWRENRHGADPDAYGYGVTHTLPNPLSISFGINANF